MTSPWLPKPTLVGELVVLRPFAADDVDAMAAMLADPDVLRLTASATSTAEIEAASPIPDERTREWYATRADVDERLDLAIVDKVSGAVVGEVVLNAFDGNARSANFRTLMGPTGRGRGLGTEAARLILGYGFEQLGLHRIELDVLGSNPRAKRVYEKVGFVVEGVRRDAFAFDGERVDEILMAILADEWASHRGRPAL
jgi:RimJ/RimL family protein N-acetyltransferase